VRAIRTTTISILAVGLLAGSAVGVAAQDEEISAQGPVEFTAKWVFGPDLRDETSEAGDGVVMSRGGAWRPGVITAASDPRLEGTLSIAANNDEYADGPTIYNYAFRIENEDGVWQQTPTLNLEHREGGASTTTGVMIGEGAYEGLIAVFDNLVEGSGWTLHGYIIEGGLPPDPEPMASD
jgi:hypothetical protein